MREPDKWDITFAIVGMIIFAIVIGIILKQPPFAF